MVYLLLTVFSAFGFCLFVLAILSAINEAISQPIIHQKVDYVFQPQTEKEYDEWLNQP
jgi:hypothetical protein